MPLYTFFMEYAGSTHVSQVRAATPRLALKTWVRGLPEDEFDELDSASKTRLVREIGEASPSQRAEMVNVWSISPRIRGQSAFINLVQTVEA
ncbi:MAG: hypothetical protein M3444_20765 [Acidobacteriota bacterium]|nr:hypothetical protein [Acidobacteriota bacterium]MDQ5836257.1 hypothetical protein [Acidobacteriota bacterium]